MQPTLCHRRHRFSAKVTKSQWEVSCTSKRVCSLFKHLQQLPATYRTQASNSPFFRVFITCLSLFLQVIFFSSLYVYNHPFFVEERWPQGHPKGQKPTLPLCSGHSPLEMLFLVYRAFLNQQFLTFERLKTPESKANTHTYSDSFTFNALITWGGVTPLHPCGATGRQEERTQSHHLKANTDVKPRVCL